MSHKTVILFSLWTSLWSALFNHIYVVFFPSFGIPWVMFVCMAIFFGMDLEPKQFYCCILSAFCGMAWGQVDFLLIDFFTKLGFPAHVPDFAAIVVGTAIAMYVHLRLLAKTPLGLMPFVFAGVCLTFSQGGNNIVGLGFTFIVGILLAAICCIGLRFCLKKQQTS